MNRTLAYGLLIAFSATCACIVVVRPYWLGDTNSFLAGFVGEGLLSLLGVILAITLASIASIHLEFNKIEERAGKRGLSKSRENLSKSAYWLIGLFLAGVVLVVAKPSIAHTETEQAAINAMCLLLVFWHALILVSLIQMIFAIKPDVE